MQSHGVCSIIPFIIAIMSLPTFPPVTLHAQDTTRRALPVIESMLEEAGEDRLGATIFLDEMEYYASHPQSAGVRNTNDPYNALLSSPFLENTIHARDSLDSPNESGAFSFPLSSEERGSIFENARISLRSTFENSFTETRGLHEHKWAGSPVHSVQRLQITARPYAAGFLLEHDPGEKFSNGFAVGYVSAAGIGILDQAIAGMFTVNAGEGLVLARSSLFSKGTISITQTKKYGAALVPYLSRDEFRYYRGAAASVETGLWSFTGFVSHRSLPATTDESGRITSFFTSGLFRTENEIGKFNAVTEKSAGLIASASPFDAAAFTFTAAAARYDKPLAASSPYAFGGGPMKAAGISFNVIQSPLSLFGEIAGHGLRSLSGVLGTIYRAAPNFSFAVHLRSYSDNYNNPFARAFGERGCANGERGIYFGIDWNISHAFGLFSYVDNFSVTDPDLFTRRGVEYLLRADGLTAKNFTYSAQVKFKTRTTLVTPVGAAHEIIDDHRQTTLRFMLRYTSPGGYILTQRCNLTRVSYGIAPQKEKGILAAADAAKHYASSGFGWKAGAVVFDTDSYDSGLTTYEPDVRGAASTSMLFGQGVRLFAMADYSPARRLTISLKYSILTKWNETTLGSGDDELLGNTDPELTVQAEVQF